MKVTQIHDLGRSLWLDNITRDLLNSGTPDTGAMVTPVWETAL